MVQPMFDQVLRWATTPQDQALIDKESQATMDGLRNQRDKSVRTILQKC